MLHRSSCSPPALHRKQKTHTHIDTGSTPVIELQRKELNSPTRPASGTATGRDFVPLRKHPQEHFPTVSAARKGNRHRAAFNAFVRAQSRLFSDPVGCPRAERRESRPTGRTKYPGSGSPYLNMWTPQSVKTPTPPAITAVKLNESEVARAIVGVRCHDQYPRAVLASGASLHCPHATAAHTRPTTISAIPKGTGGRSSSVDLAEKSNGTSWIIH
jgi:hypothetical protein